MSHYKIFITYPEANDFFFAHSNVLFSLTVKKCSSFNNQCFLLFFIYETKITETQQNCGNRIK